MFRSFGARVTSGKTSALREAKEPFRIPVRALEEGREIRGNGPESGRRSSAAPATRDGATRLPGGPNFLHRWHHHVCFYHRKEEQPPAAPPTGCSTHVPTAGR